MKSQLRKTIASNEEPDATSSDSPAGEVRYIYGTWFNIERYGSPIERAKGSHGEHIRYYFFPSWRSQFLNFIGFLVLSIICLVGSRAEPGLVITKTLLNAGTTAVVIHFPVLIVFPALLLIRMLINVYDAKYIIDEAGIEARIGFLSLNYRQPRLRWEDIRGSAPQQRLLDRLLGIGNIGIGSSMAEEVEIVMTGVTNPVAIQRLIQSERAKRLKEKQAKAAESSAPV